MKGLLIKDFKLLKNQRTFALIIGLVCIGLLVQGSDPTYVFSYAAAMFSVLGMNTIGYDEENNGMGFLFTFPVSRSKYVLEKYVFVALVLAVTLAAGFVIITVISVVKAPDHKPVEWAAVLFGVLLTSVFMQSVMIPVQIKFGLSKSRTALLIVLACIAAAIYGAKEIAEIVHLDLSAFAAKIIDASPQSAAAGVCVLSGVLMGVSYGVSAAVMKKKQF